MGFVRPCPLRIPVKDQHGRTATPLWHYSVYLNDFVMELRRDIPFSEGDFLKYKLFTDDFHNEFVDISILSTICPLFFNQPHLSEKIRSCIKSITADTLITAEDVYRPFGMRTRKNNTRNSLLRRDIFDLMMISGPSKVLTWTRERLAYVRFFYPNVPIPGSSRGLPCADTAQHDELRTLLLQERDTTGTTPLSPDRSTTTMSRTNSITPTRRDYYDHFMTPAIPLSSPYSPVTPATMPPPPPPPPTPPWHAQGQWPRYVYTAV